MLNLLKISLLLLAATNWMGCNEIPPEISLTCETERRVIVEEFTGVRCVNCPTGSAKIEELQGIHGDQLIAISIHAGFFSVPFATSPEDFTTEDGEAVDAWAGPATGWPAAMINRKIFSSESQRVLGLSTWAGRISEELCEDPLVSVTAVSSYDTTSRQVTITVTGGALTTDVISEKLGLTILITESDIVAPQTVEGIGEKEDYVHKHVLRKIITDYKGVDIHAGGSVVAGYQQTVNYTLPAHWVPANCRVVAFVHYKTGSNLGVLQATEVHLQ